GKLQRGGGRLGAASATIGGDGTRIQALSRAGCGAGHLGFRQCGGWPPPMQARLPRSAADRIASIPRAAADAGAPLPEQVFMSDKPLTDIAFSSFELHPTLLDGLESAGFTRCTPIQALTLPIA